MITIAGCAVAKVGLGRSVAVVSFSTAEPACDAYANTIKYRCNSRRLDYMIIAQHYGESRIALCGQIAEIAERSELSAYSQNDG